ncbi:hypothetical protein ACL9RL_03075 [Plantibacter sp. Mn2098]|uniref:hypothetical protein n=1 Tax=Plantibacter sp. Mn2098 TaxID=3395266 RepID=UPI003BCE6A01
MTTLTALPGNPDTIVAHATRYLDTATAINDAAHDLIDLADRTTSISKAVDKVRSLADQVAGDIIKARTRYQATAEALLQYAPKLRSAQDAASSAMMAANSAGGDLGHASYLQNYYHERALMPGPDQPEDTQKYTQAKRQVEHLQQQIGSAQSAYSQAVADRDRAAEIAMGQIDDVVRDSPLNDTFWDNLAGIKRGFDDWFDKVIAPILEGILDALKVVVRVLAALAAAVMLLANLPWTLLAAGIGLFGYLTGNEALIGVAMALLTPMIAGWVYASIFTAAGTPKVTPRQQPGDVVFRNTDDKDAYQTLFTDQAVIDELGIDDTSGVIQVTKVIGPDGTVSWRVQVPSTQYWNLPWDLTSGPNSLDGNLAAKLSPGRESQLKAAVIEAMRQAGVGPGEAVMLSGFSQGGIVAANLAADESFRTMYNVKAVVTAGAPIGDVSIPASVNVISFEHTGDAVPTLDYGATNPDRSNWVTVRDTAANGDTSVSSHNAALYARTASDYLDPSDPMLCDTRGKSTGDPAHDAALAQMVQENQRFFVGTEAKYRYEAVNG